MASGRGDIPCSRCATLGNSGTTHAVDYRRCPCINCCTGFLLMAVRDDPWLLRRPSPFGIWIWRVYISCIFGVGSNNVLDGSRSCLETNISEWRKEELILTVFPLVSPYQHRPLRFPAWGCSFPRYSDIVDKLVALHWNRRERSPFEGVQLSLCRVKQWYSWS